MAVPVVRQRSPSAPAGRRLFYFLERNLIRQFCEIRDFILRLRVQMRFGRLSRAPLHLLRLELNADTAHCEWIARSADAWDKDLPQGAAECNEAEQALDDALAVRDLLFYALPSLATASFRVFRQPA